jgi:predicted phage tail protein
VIRIVPVVIGSKKAGLLQTILGAVLVVVGVVTSAYGGAPLIAQVLIMMLVVVVQIFASANIASKQSADNRASYAFGGVTNTAAQGYPVPPLWSGESAERLSLPDLCRRSAVDN